MEVKELLQYIDPDCDYTDWVKVGMALKQEGYPVSVWDAWSAKSFSKYTPGACEKKWRTFNGTTNPVAAGTIYNMALEGGYIPEKGGHELDWDSPITTDGLIVDANWVEEAEIQEPTEWTDKQCKQELITYLETLFDAGENVGLNVKSFENEKGKFTPKDKGLYSKTAGELIEDLRKHNTLQEVIGDYDPKAGAWIRFNPLDGKGVKNSNVTDFRYALVESDDMELEKQFAMLREMALPIAVLVHSGSKSLHAIVRVDASGYDEYRKRVDYLYSICEKNGMTIDQQNRNPSRLSRMPGVTRDGKKQFIVATNIGKKSWNEWVEWVEAVNDDLPDIEGLANEWDNLPELAPELIQGVLRQGHKMLIAGPSKAGKSFALIELCIAIAEGRTWLRWPCTKGSVLYVNLELDRASCLHRFKDVYTALSIAPTSLHNIDIWNLRGQAIPMDKLAPKLIRRAQKRGYMAIIIDPIYKVITGDENSADQMSQFCNQFDKICNELGCAVIYCHHHSKGSQGQKKAIDRSSGSGVFARDPDAVLDYIELELTQEMKDQQENKAICQTCQQYMDSHMAWTEDLDPDSRLNATHFKEFCKNTLSKDQWEELNAEVQAAVKDANSQTAWRIEGTLREFASFEPVDCWFRYPVHAVDKVQALKNVQPDDNSFESQKNKLNEKRKKEAEQKKIDELFTFDTAFEGLEKDGRVKLQDIAEQIGKDAAMVGKWFGNSKQKSRDNFKTKYKSVYGEDGYRYIVRQDEKEAEK